MNIQSTGGLHELAQLLRGGRAGAPSGAPQGLPPQGVANTAASITNERGESLLDLRGELRSAVRGALQAYDGQGDVRSVVQDALAEALEANGFDPAEVRGALRPEGFDPWGGGRAGAGGPGSPGGFDAASLLLSGSDDDDLVQAFLEQFRAGVGLDLEA